MKKTNPYTAAIRKLKASHPIFAKHIQSIGPCKLIPEKSKSPYESLVRSIVFQQLSGKAAQTILNRFISLFPKTRFPEPEHILKMPHAKIRSAGLSEAKTRAILDLAEKTRDGLVPTVRDVQKLSDEELIERLTQIRGVGPWTVQMYLIFTLGRPDVWPIDDYGVRKGYAKIFGLADLPKPKELLQFGEIWKPYRSLAAWYLWRALDTK